MSPQQATGRPLDARSEVFSFGVVLHEVLTGHRPSIGTANPLPETIPASLRTLTHATLQKDAADRVRTMREVAGELRRVVRHTGETALPPRSSGARAVLWAAAIAVLAAAATIVTLVIRNQPDPARETQSFSLTSFADSATSPALSPDGRMLAFIRGPSTFFGPGQIYVKQLPDGEPVQLTDDRALKFGPQFTPDGSHVSYTTGSVLESTLMDTWLVRLPVDRRGAS